MILSLVVISIKSSLRYFDINECSIIVKKTTIYTCQKIFNHPIHSSSHTVFVMLVLLNLYLSELCSVVGNLLLTIALYDVLNWLIFPFVSSNLYTGYIGNTNRYFRYNCYTYYIFLLNKCQ